MLYMHKLCKNIINEAIRADVNSCIIFVVSFKTAFFPPWSFDLPRENNLNGEEVTGFNCFLALKCQNNN